MIDKEQDANITDSFDTLDSTVEMDYDQERTIPHLVVLAGDSIGKVVRLRRNHSLKAGRTRDCELCFDCDNISRKHASVEVDGEGKTTITDLNSTNGTLVNGKKIKEAILNDGDRICMGDIILRYSFKDNIEFDLQQDLYDKATKDPLTQTFNRRYFMDIFQKEFAFHKRQSLPLSLILIDLDDLKQLNDTYGHVNGDMVLKSLSREIMSCMRKEDILARFGGEEFIALFRCTPRKVALTIGNKLIELISAMNFSTPTLEFSTSSTIGLATLMDNNYETLEEMLIAADKNLYLGKEQGKNIVVG